MSTRGSRLLPFPHRLPSHPHAHLLSSCSLCSHLHSPSSQIKGSSACSCPCLVHLFLERHERKHSVRKRKRTVPVITIYQFSSLPYSASPGTTTVLCFTWAERTHTARWQMNHPNSIFGTLNSLQQIYWTGFGGCRSLREPSFVTGSDPSEKIPGTESLGGHSRAGPTPGHRPLSIKINDRAGREESSDVRTSSDPLSLAAPAALALYWYEHRKALLRLIFIIISKADVRIFMRFSGGFPGRCVVRLVYTQHALTQ